MSTTAPDVTAYSFTRRAWVAAPPERVYELVGDVSLIGTWSPSADAAVYDEGDGPRVGAWFTGRNHRGDREWSSRSRVVAAEPGSDFAFVVDDLVRWHWTFLPHGTGTEVRQSWTLLRPDPVLGTTDDDLAALRDHMADSVETTLVALAAWVASGQPVG
ncbi:SRPBCC family protein [Umezawaea tangerina]|uniref:Polyketide cyclase/dehydrase/lipid transport protein n=1 Tax=Umezawaea tangerina TaxID=84725 RepID=A0A2T0SMX7_9PSEU|nr:SRPBCC family protein [Umezawaea tangerina]PRY34745.1 polyketide cyclase/dehydrase/lipid transport protein [Umezawaea tangerina]